MRRHVSYLSQAMGLGRTIQEFEEEVAEDTPIAAFGQKNDINLI